MDPTQSLQAIVRARPTRAGQFAVWAEQAAGWRDAPHDQLLTLTPIKASDVQRATRAAGAPPPQLALLTATGPLDESRVVPTPYRLGSQLAVYSIEDPAFGKRGIPKARFVRLLQLAPAASKGHDVGVAALEDLAQRTGSILVFVESRPLPATAATPPCSFEDTPAAAAAPQRPYSRRPVGEPVTEEPVGPYDPRTVWQRYQPALVGTMSAITGFALGAGIARRLM